TEIAMQVLTTTIKREFFRKIVAREKRVEYREIKPYWTKRLATMTTPFLLHLVNGMTHPIPELTVVVTRVRKNVAQRRYELQLGTVRAVKRWDRRRERPRQRPTG
ncbi:MAG: hypothetical protein M3T56_14770, partial [Chloroflexota bacterium]|nr:hypothetical protein [Chloroflexota bacterium]